VRAAIEDNIRKVRVVQSSPKGHRLNQEFLTALEERDTKALAKCLDELEALERDHKRLLRRDELREQLSKAAPKLARQLQSTFADSSWEQRARDFEAAWAWKQADKWLTRFSQEHDKIKLETELQQLCADERRIISGFAAAEAWENCLQSMTEHQRANLIAWAKTIKKIGKGTGKYAPMYRRQAQQYMDECKGAIPAWVMPLYRVFETVKPEPEVFDVIIIDEASQTGPEGLVIQYLAKQCIVVGDDE
jgi:Asp-tRNA(Asn)/Glu-tRNA(Gln) amidotransferase A subunit family amidase